MNARFTNSFVKSSFLVAAVAVALTGCGGSGASTNGVATKLAASYTLELVEPPAGSTWLELDKISPNGAIAGKWGTGNGYVCFKYMNGVRTDVTPENSDIRITSVSDDGTIEGNYEVADYLFPFSTSGVGFHDITKPGTYAEGINYGKDTGGRTTLTFAVLNQDIEAYREKGGVYTPLTAPNATVIVPKCSSPSGYIAAIGFFSGTYKPLRFTPDSNVGTPFLEDINSLAISAINDLGSVGGYVSEGSKHFPYVNINGQTTQMAGLGGTFSQISGINNGNVAVGRSSTTGDIENHAIGWSVTDGQVDLTTRIPSTPGFTAYYSTGIDNKGRIVGYGRLNGTMVGFIMTPVAP